MARINPPRNQIPAGVLWGYPGAERAWGMDGVAPRVAAKPKRLLKTYRVTYRNASGTHTTRTVKAPNSATIKHNPQDYIPEGKVFVGCKWVRTHTTAVNGKPLTYPQAQRKALRDLQLHAWNNPRRT